MKKGKVSVIVFDFIVDTCIHYNLHRINRIICFLFPGTFSDSCQPLLDEIDKCPDDVVPMLSEAESEANFQKIIAQLKKRNE